VPTGQVPAEISVSLQGLSLSGLEGENFQV